MQRMLTPVIAVLLGLESATAQLDPTPLPATSSPKVFETGVAAFVNRDVITKAEVWRELGANREGLAGERLREAYQQALLSLIRQKTFDQASEQLQLVINPEAVKSIIENEKEQLGGEEAFRESLVERGLTEEEYAVQRSREYQRFVLLGAQTGNIRPVGLVLRAEHVIEPTAQEIRDYYRSNLESFRAGATAKVRVITLSRSRFGDLERAAAVAREIREDLRTGADFATLATRHSSDRAEVGGDLGWIDQGSDWAPEILEFAFSGPVGEVSEPLQFRNGYFLVLVEERKESRTTPFEEAQVKIREKLKTERNARARLQVELKVLRETYIEPALYKDALIDWVEGQLAGTAGR